MIDAKVNDLTTQGGVDSSMAMPPQRTESKQANAMEDETSPNGAVEATTEEIAALAYQLWMERGAPHGSHEEDWFRAEQQLRGGHKSTKSASA